MNWSQNKITLHFPVKPIYIADILMLGALETSCFNWKITSCLWQCNRLCQEPLAQTWSYLCSFWWIIYKCRFQIWTLFKLLHLFSKIFTNLHPASVVWVLKLVVLKVFSTSEVLKYYIFRKSWIVTNPGLFNKWKKWPISHASICVGTLVSNVH